MAKYNKEDRRMLFAHFSFLSSSTLSADQKDEKWQEFVAATRLKFKLKEKGFLEEVFFTNAQEKSKSHSDTFYAPSIEGLSKLRPKDHVKVILNDVERVWVRIMKIDVENQTINGFIDNDLIFTIIHGKRYRSRLTFKFENVADFLTQKEYKEDE